MRSPDPLQDLLYFVRDPWPWGKPHEAAGIHRASRRRSSRMADCGARAAAGYIRAGTPHNDPFREEFLRGMRDLGYVEGRNIAIAHAELNAEVDTKSDEQDRESNRNQAERSHHGQTDRGGNGQADLHVTEDMHYYRQRAFAVFRANDAHADCAFGADRKRRVLDACIGFCSKD